MRFEIVQGDEQLSSHSGLVLVGALLRTYAVEIVEALFDIAMKVTVNSFRNLGLGMVIVFLAYLVVYLIWNISDYSIKEIVLSKEGVVFRRKRNPIVIQRIPNIEEVSGGRVLKLTGLTSEGKTVKRR